MRSFLAVRLASPAAALLTDACDAYRSSDPMWAGEKWVRPDHMHVTLAFFPALDEVAAHDVLDATRLAIGDVRPFEALLERTVAVPGAARARMLWAVFTHGSLPMQGLHARVLPVASAFGSTPDRRPFVPHITLVRARKARPARESSLADATSIISSATDASRIVSVSDVTLFQSRLGPSGPRYTDIGSALLGSD